MDNEQLIRKNLAAIGEDYDVVSDNIKAYLISIQGVLGRKKAEQLAAIKALQDSRATVSGICAELNMSRNTAYRYEGILQRYIEYCAEQLDSTNPLDIAEKLRDDNTEKQRQLGLMADRDIEALSSQIAVHQRDRQLQEKKRLLEQKDARILELTRDCQQLRIALEKNDPGHRLLKFP